MRPATCIKYSATYAIGVGISKITYYLYCPGKPYVRKKIFAMNSTSNMRLAIAAGLFLRIVDIVIVGLAE
jgi:CRISPR/Cas system-associated exonuclease Cas4 (RecB family)